MPRVGLELTIPVFERPKTVCALNRSVIGTILSRYESKNVSVRCFVNLDSRTSENVSQGWQTTAREVLNLTHAEIQTLKTVDSTCFLIGIFLK
jgi:hypothetical protein